MRPLFPFRAFHYIPKLQFPLPHVFPLPPFPLKREPTASAPRGDTLGSRIDRGISLIMPLRLRGGYATECHAFSYLSSSSALIFSPPCDSNSVFEWAHTVYKNASNRLKSSANARSAISPAQRADITVEEHQYHCAIKKLKI